jgi:ABC-type protease/lipase transport system fused ATPase/permease subunit
MGMTPAVTDRFVHHNDQVMAAQTRSSYVAGSIQAVIKPGQATIQVMIYCFGAYYAMTQGFDVGLMVAGAIIMGRGLAPLMQLMGSWRQARHAWEAFNRIRQATRTPVQDPALSGSHAAAGPHRPDPGGQGLVCHERPGPAASDHV